MNESHDDLAAAWLDGELSQAELAALPSDPELRQARDQQAEVRALLAAPVAVPPGLVDLQVARAVAELDRVLDEERRQGVVPLASRRASRAWLSRAAAAVLVVTGVGAALVASQRDDARQEEQAALSAAGEAEPEAATTADGGGAANEARAADDTAGTEGTAGGGVGAAGAESVGGAALGDVSAAATELLAGDDLGPQELLAELEQRFGPAATWEAAPGGAGGCGATLPAGGEGPAVAVPVQRDGAELELLVAGEEVLLVEAGTCRPLP